MHIIQPSKAHGRRQLVLLSEGPDGLIVANTSNADSKTERRQSWDRKGDDCSGSGMYGQS